MMALYDVFYFVKTTGRSLAACDLKIPWESIALPPRGQVARCESTWDHTVTWLDPSGQQIPAPAFA